MSYGRTQKRKRKREAPFHSKISTRALHMEASCLAGALEDFALKAKGPCLEHEPLEIWLAARNKAKKKNGLDTGCELRTRGRLLTSSGLSFACTSSGSGFFLNEMSSARFSRRSLRFPQDDEEQSPGEATSRERALRSEHILHAHLFILSVGDMRSTASFTSGSTSLRMSSYFRPEDKGPNRLIVITRRGEARAFKQKMSVVNDEPAPGDKDP